VTSGSVRGSRDSPHWLLLLVVPILIGLLLTWFGINDWRVPWAKPTTTPTPSMSTATSPAPSPNGRNVAPVKLRMLSDGGVDVTWSALSDSELNYYSVDVSAVSPITYTYGVPYHPGIVDTSSRIHPAPYLNKLLSDERRTERVAPGQIWHVCVTGMRATPNNVDITPYIIKGSKACSDDFTLP